MGIPGLTSYMSKKFTGWRPIEFKDLHGVIIDGYDVCSTLYKQNYSWRLGGEHAQFKRTLEKFFQDANFKDPIVVLGGSAVGVKDRLPLLCHRRMEHAREIQDVQNAVGWELNTRVNDRVSAPMISTVLIEVLKTRKIKYCISESDLGREIAALANQHGYPVLGTNGDYFIFYLQHGYIDIQRYFKGQPALYNIRDFLHQFSLRQYELCLILPTIFVNDYLLTYRCKTTDDYGRVLAILAKFENVNRYLTSEKAAVTFQTFEFYKQRFSNIQLPAYYTSGDSTAFKQAFPALPEWVFHAYRAGEFPTQLLIVCRYRNSILPNMVEAIQYDSAWKASRGIRQHLYSLMGMPKEAQIKEYIRKKSDSETGEEIVHPKPLKEGNVSVSDQLFIDKDEKLYGLVYCILKCHKLSPEDENDFNNSLDNRWKLPVAATFYWYRMLEDPPNERNIVKSLLLSFLTCSNEIADQSHPLPPVTSETKEAHLKALHALAKWQCVYSDAVALNHVARQPLETVSPSSLYSGQVAMYYATMFDLANDHLLVGDRWKLYNTFLYLITGCDEEGKEGRHKVRPKTSDTSWQTVK